MECILPPPSSQLRNSRSKTQTIKQWNLFRKDPTQLKPLHISQQVLKHKRLLLEKLDQNQRLAHNNLTLLQIARSKSCNNNRRVKARSHLLDRGYWDIRKQVEQKRDEIKRIQNVVRERESSKEEVGELHRRLKEIWERLDNGGDEKQDQVLEVSKENGIEEETKQLRNARVDLIEKMQREKKRGQELDRKIRLELNEQGRLMRDKQRLEQTLSFKYLRR